MIEDDPLASLIGHNQAPSHADLSVSELDLELDPLIKRRDQFVTTMANVKVRTRNEAGAAADVIKLATQFADVVEKKREAVSQPLFDAHKAVIARARAFLSPMEELLGDPDIRADAEPDHTTIHGKIVAWQRAETARIDAQKAEQAKAEAELRAAAAPVSHDMENSGQARESPEGDRGSVEDGPTGRAKLEYANPDVATPVSEKPIGVVLEPRSTQAPVIRGDYGATLGRRKKVTAEIEDLSKIGMEILDTDVVRAAITKVATALAQHQKSIPGIRINRGAINQVK